MVNLRLKLGKVVLINRQIRWIEETVRMTEK